MRMGLKGIAIGFGVGYVLGAKAGRERYDQIQDLWAKVSGNPTVQKAAENAKHMAGDAGRKGMEAVQGGVTKASSAVKSRLGDGSEATSGYATGT
jgi:hypothetical protein